MRLRGILACCLASLALAALLSLFVLDRPLSQGRLRAALAAGPARAAELPGPRLIILAGSNGPYSHSCAVLEARLGLPCVNAGVAVGIGLDHLFALWERELRPGDVVYMPMEPAQYARGRLATAGGADAGMLARHDRATLWQLTPERWAGALFGQDLAGLALGLAEPALHAAGLRPRAEAVRFDARGDAVGHGPERAARAALAAMQVVLPTPERLRAGHGARLIGAFTRRMTARGVRVIGGPAVGFDDLPLDAARLEAMADAFRAHGGAFVLPEGAGRYPRAWFFDGPEHLAEPGQRLHSARVADALAPLLGAAWAEAGGVKQSVAGAWRPD
jgi:hypothetical protein